MSRALGAALLGLAIAMSASSLSAEVSVRTLEFSDLKGWAEDDHSAAFEVFKNTCTDLKDPDWLSLCAVASQQKNARQFFELFFKPVLMTDGNDALFTGYYEPELTGSRTQSDRFAYPLYRTPPEVTPGTPWLTRKEIEEGGALADRNLEIVWLENPVDKFFLQVQGSGRIRLAEGGLVRVGYGGKNGHEYRSIGQELIRRQVFEPHEVSAQVIRNWVAENPVDGRALLQHNNSYVFFREVSDVPADQGPLGAMNRSITEGRSIAVDPGIVPLGAPVWIEKDGADPMRRLMVAQDTGSAIKGAQRADIFYGTGDEAGRQAGRVRDAGRMVVLLPIQRAYSSVTEPGK
ncbi:murein transglycosylase A [Cognatishimia sp. MH4019]|uniref:murein transglycosylase A n=1 Tax=Cognatishimia sp. MH4019 TaxID=2854030 RepID=UPI001CD35164|nr:MltA domain-containing protein [Cognatishimia sp. MH4019]